MEGSVTQQSVYETIAKAAELTQEQASQLVRAVFELIAREMSAGEEVEVDGLGKFYTEEIPAQTIEDPPGSGNTVITLPLIEPAFDPDPDLERAVAKAVEANPDLFADDDEDDDDEDDGDDASAKPEPVREKPAEEKEEKEEKQAPPPPQPEPERDEKEDEGTALKVPEDPALPGNERPLGRASYIEFVDLDGRKIDREILLLIPENIARQFGAVPIDLQEGVLTVAMIDPEDFDALQVIRKESGLAVKPVLTTRDDLATILDQYTGLQAEVQEVIDASDITLNKEDVEAAAQEEAAAEANTEDSPTVKIVYSLLKRAVKEKASDIHIEPYEQKVVVRFRQDGILQKKVELPKAIQSAVISRLKIMANLKIDEQRLPQDGRFNLTIDKKQVDFRLSTIPVVNGEKVVMRILDKSVGIIDLEDVGMAGRGLAVLKKNMQRSHGMILVTGPTGSGKTTTLYAVLGRLMAEDVNIITLEDPVEYRIESINQSQVHSEIGYSFATGLRSIVRQDPDIVMLGEIRDQETANMAIQAALTGHVVLSTLHTNDAAGAFPRLIDMQIEPFLITSSVHTVIAQRLARKICLNCRVEKEIDKDGWEEVDAEINNMPDAIRAEVKKMDRKMYYGKGCDHCGGKGYTGRIGIFEVLDVSDDTRKLIMKRSSGEEITAQAIKGGMITMVQDGIIKALQGITTLEEVWRVTRE
jgi:type IV pilus assembly protein PilB